MLHVLVVLFPLSVISVDAADTEYHNRVTSAGVLLLTVSLIILAQL